MQKLLFLYLLLFVEITFVDAQQRDKKLEAKIAERVQGFKGEVGIYVKDLRSGRISLYNADSVFPTASIVKVPILLGVTAAVENGQHLRVMMITLVKRTFIH